MTRLAFLFFCAGFIISAAAWEPTRGKYTATIKANAKVRTVASKPVVRKVPKRSKTASEMDGSARDEGKLFRTPSRVIVRKVKSLQAETVVVRAAMKS